MQFALQHIKLIWKGIGHATLISSLELQYLQCEQYLYTTNTTRVLVFTTFMKMIPLCVLSIVRANLLLLVGAGNLRPVVQLPWSHAADPQTAGLGWAGLGWWAGLGYMSPASADLGHHSSNVSN